MYHDRASGSLLIIVALNASSLFAQEPAHSKDWIEKSNRYANLLLDVAKKYNPEDASSEGLAEYDTKISVPTLAEEKAERKEREAVLATLKNAAKSETDKNVAQDLAILIKSTEHDFHEEDYAREHLVPFLNPTNFVYFGIETLLGPQTPDARRPAAVTRLKEYAGQAEGYRRITQILQERELAQMAKPNMVYPSRERLRRSWAATPP